MCFGSFFESELYYKQKINYSVNLKFNTLFDSFERNNNSYFPLKILKTLRNRGF